MDTWTRMLRWSAAAPVVLLLAAAPVRAQVPAPLEQIGIPPAATALEGRPEGRVETTESTAERRALTEREAVDSRLTITVRGGRLYWGAQQHELSVNPAGEFVYLSSQPGHYVRVRRIDGRLSYVEHLDMGTRSVTYWGELRVVLGR